MALTMRIRSIKGEFFSSEKVAQLSIPARLLFAGMWSFADDFGRGRANAALLKAHIFPFDDMPVSEVSDWFKEIDALGLVHTYEAEGKDWYHVVDWFDNQAAQFRRNKNPLYPDPTCVQGDTSCVQLALNCVQNDADGEKMGARSSRGEEEGKSVTNRNTKRSKNGAEV